MRISDWSSDVCSSDLVGKFICIGLNYSDHAAETGNPIPSEPIIFMKATSAITGPDDDVIIPKDSVKTDWEVELGVVIGSTARYVEDKDALRSEKRRVVKECRRRCLYPGLP